MTNTVINGLITLIRIVINQFYTIFSINSIIMNISFYFTLLTTCRDLWFLGPTWIYGG